MAKRRPGRSRSQFGTQGELMAFLRSTPRLMLREPYPVPWWRHRALYAVIAFLFPWASGLLLPFWWNIFASVIAGGVLAVVSLVVLGPQYVVWKGPRDARGDANREGS